LYRQSRIKGEAWNFAGFDWDAGNSGKCRQHGVTREVIEELFLRPLASAPDPLHSVQEERFKAIGRSREGRYVMVVFTVRHRGEEALVRPISARYMHRKEIETYENLFETEEASGAEKRPRG
jgi:hypothetical protein